MTASTQELNTSSVVRREYRVDYNMAIEITMAERDIPLADFLFRAILEADVGNLEGVLHYVRYDENPRETAWVPDSDLERDKMEVILSARYRADEVDFIVD